MSPEFFLPFIPITFFISLAVLLYYFIQFRHGDRMAIIDKGLEKEQLDFFMKRRAPYNKSTGLYIKLAVILIGIGLAMLIALFFPENLHDQVLGGLIFLLPGLGLLLIVRMEMNLQKQKGHTADIPEL